METNVVVEREEEDQEDSNENQMTILISSSSSEREGNEPQQHQRQRRQQQQQTSRRPANSLDVSYLVQYGSPTLLASPPILPSSSSARTAISAGNVSSARTSMKMISSQILVQPEQPRCQTSKGSTSTGSTNECAICYDVLNDDLKVTRCGHIYHRVCIENALKYQPLCPICRNRVVRQQLIPVFLNHVGGSSSICNDHKMISDGVSTAHHRTYDEASCTSEELQVLQGKFNHLQQQNENLKMQCQMEKSKNESFQKELTEARAETQRYMKMHDAEKKRVHQVGLEKCKLQREMHHLQQRFQQVQESHAIVEFLQDCDVTQLQRNVGGRLEDTVRSLHKAILYKNRQFEKVIQEKMELRQQVDEKEKKLQIAYQKVLEGKREKERLQKIEDDKLGSSLSKQALTSATSTTTSTFASTLMPPSNKRIVTASAKLKAMECQDIQSQKILASARRRRRKLESHALCSPSKASILPSSSLDTTRLKKPRSVSSHMDGTLNRFNSSSSSSSFLPLTREVCLANSTTGLVNQGVDSIQRSSNSSNSSNSRYCSSLEKPFQPNLCTITTKPHTAGNAITASATNVTATVNSTANVTATNAAAFLFPPSSSVTPISLNASRENLNPQGNKAMQQKARERFVLGARSHAGLLSVDRSGLDRRFQRLKDHFQSSTNSNSISSTSTSSAMNGIQGYFSTLAARTKRGLVAAPRQAVDVNRRSSVQR